MSGSIRISLRPGEKIYVNGAVLRADRKVSLELMNDVTFLLESHVLHAQDATTPLRQLYFVVQTMLVDPSAAAAARLMFDEMLPRFLASFENAEVLSMLQSVAALVAAGRDFEALKAIRSLFAVEAMILADGVAAPDRAA
jgi:flagellar protein FlbT